jgi:PKD repeat protein
VTGGTPPLSYYWNFGDGGTSILADPVHEFAAVGSYNVSLEVTDRLAEVADYSSVILVSSAAGTAYPLEVTVQPGDCSGIDVGNVWAKNNTKLELPPGGYSIVAGACPGEVFAYWTTSGSSIVTNSSRSSAEVHLTGPGTLSASYTPATPARGPTGIAGVVFRILPPIGWTLLGLVILVVSVWGFVFVGRRQAARRSSPANPPVPRTPNR